MRLLVVLFGLAAAGILLSRSLPDAERAPEWIETDEWLALEAGDPEPDSTAEEETQDPTPKDTASSIPASPGEQAALPYPDRTLAKAPPEMSEAPDETSEIEPENVEAVLATREMGEMGEMAEPVVDSGERDGAEQRGAASQPAAQLSLDDRARLVRRMLSLYDSTRGRP